MHSLIVGDTVIPWDLRFSDQTIRKRIEVTPEGVLVVAPEGTPVTGEDGVEAFVDSRRRWVYDAVRDIERRSGDMLRQHFESGATVPHRGRNLRLEVQPDDVDEVVIECRSRFHVRVPATLGREARQEAVRDALLGWMRERGLQDARTWATRHGAHFGVEPTIRLADQKTMWGSCGKDTVLRINWQLIQAPAIAMEYVVAHEVCHLVERNHTDRFWAAMGEVMPDWKERKALLERWEREQQMERRVL